MEMPKDKKVRMLREETAPSDGAGSRPDEALENGARRRPDPEVPAKPKRRRFTAEYKLRILEEIDRAGPGGGGAVLRREGLYSSHLTEWRRARRDGSLQALSRKRGRKPKPANPLQKKVDRLERELARAQEELRKAHIIIDVQGKVAGLLGVTPEDGKNS